MSYSRMYKSFTFLFLLFTFVTSVRADDDEDILGELMTDLLIGAAVAVCESYATCNAILTVITIISILILICGCIFGDEHTRKEIWEGLPPSRRIAGTGAGYYLTKRY